MTHSLPPKDPMTTQSRPHGPDIPEPTRDPSSSPEAATQQTAPAGIGFVGLLRWAWRQLTTMRTALILLLMLALAIIAASLLPQRIQDPTRVASFIEDNGQWGEVLDTFQLFDVHSSVWFASIYILLMVSLVGCVLPRTRQHLRAMRQDPPKAPRRLARMPGYARFALPVSTSPEGLLTQSEQLLKKNGYRTMRHSDHIAAERGYLRETGNLVFHIALLGVVITMGVGSLFGYSGQRVLVEGDTFTNSLVAYDSFEPGPFFHPDRMQDFRLRLDSFEATFDDQAAGNQFGQPRTFEAEVTEFSGGQESQHLLRVNEPIRVGGAGVYLLGNGYAPVITVRDSTGTVIHSGPVVFLPQDGVYTSRGVLKVPDATPDQLGFVGILLPTVGQNDSGELVSTFADLRNPYLVMSAYRGNLGLDEGIPQSVYELDADNMTELTDATGAPLVIQLSPGQTQQLPDGLGSVTFDRVDRFIAFDVRHDPTQGWMLVISLALMAGLGLSLFVPRRRMWVRATGDTVEVAALARGEDPRVGPAAVELATALNNSETE